MHVIPCGLFKYFHQVDVLPGAPQSNGIGTTHHILITSGPRQQDIFISPVMYLSVTPVLFSYFFHIMIGKIVVCKVLILYLFKRPCFTHHGQYSNGVYATSNKKPSIITITKCLKIVNLMIQGLYQ